MLINKFNKSLNFKVAKEKIIFLGSLYGGWSFLEKKNLNNNYIVSAGLGEDASFDIELINRYNCKIILIDPTPRAIEHYKEIMKKKDNQNQKYIIIQANKKLKATIYKILIMKILF